MAAAMAALEAARKSAETNEAKMRVAEKQMRAAFDAIDEDHSGELDTNEILKALERIGEYSSTSPNRHKVLRWVNRAVGTDGSIGFEEYKKLIERMRLEKNKWKVPVPWLKHNGQVAKFYQLSSVQFFVAAVIVINFLAIIVEKEIDPYPAEQQRYRPVWQAIDNTCNIIFLIELLVNLYGSFWRPFVCNAWNYLDTVVVLVGILSMANVDLSSFSQIKILRAFRILRLFNKVASLNRIIIALVRSIPGVINAFIVMFIFMAIFAVLAVDLFRDFAPEGTYDTIQTYGPADATWGAGSTFSPTQPHMRKETRSTVLGMTGRGFHYGQEYFSTFSRSLYTLFQVLTGESWSEAVVRPLLFGWDAGNAVVVGVFFTLFILLTAIILQNVVVTVLLDNFLSDDTKAAAEEKNQDANMAKRMAGGAPAAAPATAPARARAISTTALSGEQLALMRERAATMQAELVGTLEQCQQIVKLLPPGF